MGHSYSKVCQVKTLEQAGTAEHRSSIWKWLTTVSNSQKMKLAMHCISFPQVS